MAMTEQNVCDVEKEIQTKLAKKLLDVIILQLLNAQPMHGYELISKIRKNFGVYFGPSTIYPLLSTLEKSACIISQWDMEKGRPKKVYSLTTEGQDMLVFAENSISLLCQKMFPSLISAEETPAFTKSDTNIGSFTVSGT